jgi:hypothetical protein
MSAMLTRHLPMLDIPAAHFVAANFLKCGYAASFVVIDVLADSVLKNIQLIFKPGWRR